MADNTAGQTKTAGVDQATGQFASGKVVFDATTIVATEYVRIECGFLPRHIEWENLTDRIKVEWNEGMTTSQCLKTAAAGTRTLDTTALAVVPDSKGFRILQDATLAAILASKTCYWRAYG